MTSHNRGKRPIEEITEPQRRTLHEIRLFTTGHGLFPPTINVVSEVLGISHASVHGQVNQLVRKGYLKREPRQARSIVIIRGPDSQLE